MMEWKVTITDKKQEQHILTLANMEKWQDSSIPVDDFLPGKKAEAVFFKRILQELQIPMNFTQAKVEAEDGFTQEVGLNDLETAFLVFKHQGELLTKGFPARIYVPTAADCLNVKSVVHIQLD